MIKTSTTATRKVPSTATPTRNAIVRSFIAKPADVYRTTNSIRPVPTGGPIDVPKKNFRGVVEIEFSHAALPPIPKPLPYKHLRRRDCRRGEIPGRREKQKPECELLAG